MESSKSDQYTSHSRFKVRLPQDPCMRTNENIPVSPKISYVNNATDANPRFGAPPPPGKEVRQFWFLGPGLLCEAPLSPVL